MTNEKIFFRPNSSADLSAFERKRYDDEAVLQKALADFPEVIAGFTTTDVEPLRLLLIKQEMAIALADTKSTMRIDHFYADTDGVPVLVEVKRSSDTRIRREVVAQLLEYAANAAEVWTFDVIRAALEARLGPQEGGVEKALSDLGIQDSVDDYLTKVVENLVAGRLRMMIVADQIPESLRRIIEFLNAQMTPAEILGVEVPQYIGAEGVAYVPRLVGQTTAAKVKKEAATGGQLWDEDSLLEEADASASPDEAQLVRVLLDHVRSAGGRFSWGRGSLPGVGGWYLVGDREYGLWILRIPRRDSDARAKIEFRLPDLVKTCGEARTRAALIELARIPGASERLGPLAKESELRGWPTVFLDEVSEVGARTHLFHAIDILRGAVKLTGL